MSLHRTPEQVSSGRNSSIREWTLGLRRPIARKLAQLRIQPDWITNTSLMGSVATTLWANRNTLKEVGSNVKTALVQAIFVGLDALDGETAREWNKIWPDKHDTFKGGIKDASADKMEEQFQGADHIIMSYIGGSRWGEIAAIGATATASLPALTRSMVEYFRGVEVPEGGIGKRAVRAGFNILGTNFPKTFGLPIQPTTDFVNTGGNLYATGERLWILLHPNNAPKLGKDDADNARLRQEAKMRMLAMLGATAQGLAVSVVLPITLRYIGRERFARSLHVAK